MGDIETMARTIWGEARSEGETGMIAVANVILNRVAKQTHFGLTISEVCRKSFQFSCWNADDPNRNKMMTVTDSNPQYEQALAIAQRGVAGKLVDNTDNATFYFVTGSPLPFWAEGHVPCKIIGRHSFFNDIL